MLASSLAMLFSRRRKIVAVDCDVDAPNLAIWLGEPKDWQEIKIKKIRRARHSFPLISGQLFFRRNRIKKSG